MQKHDEIGLYTKMKIWNVLKRLKMVKSDSTDKITKKQMTSCES